MLCACKGYLPKKQYFQSGLFVERYVLISDMLIETQND